MSVTPEKEFHNPWDQRASFAPIGSRSLLLSLVIVFLCALAVPLATFHQGASTLILAVLFLYVATTVRVPFAVAFLLGTVFVITSLTGSLAIGATVLALVVGTGTAAFLITSIDVPWTILLLSASAFCFSFAVSLDWRLSLLSFAFLPAALLLAVATRRGEIRTTAICFSMAGLLAVIAVGVGGYLYYGSAARGMEISEFVFELRDAFFAYLVRKRDESGAILQAVTQTEFAFNETYTDEVLLAQATQSFYVFPAICCVFCGVVAFEAQILLNGLYRSAGWKQVLTPRSMIFTMSLTSAVIYFVTFVLSMFPMEATMAALVIANLNTMLMPGFLVIGVTMLTLTLARSKSGSKSIWILLIGGLLCCRLDMALPLVSLFGANSVVLGTVHQKMKDKQGE